MIMENGIVTPAEVVRLAFADGGYVSPEAIGEADIAAAVGGGGVPGAGGGGWVRTQGSAVPRA